VRLDTLDATAVNTINEIKRNYEQQINELNTQYEQRCHSLQAQLQEYHHKYLIIKEKYDLLLYKRFIRSAEQLKADKSQRLLFTEEGAKTVTAEEAETVELIEIKSHKRNKKGRKEIDPKLPRIERIIDIPESEKTCACGVELTRMGRETAG
jgi:transposase